MKVCMQVGHCFLLAEFHHVPKFQWPLIILSARKNPIFSPDLAPDHNFD